MFRVAAVVTPADANRGGHCGGKSTHRASSDDRQVSLKSEVGLNLCFRAII